MTFYADTGFLVSLHTVDANTDAAQARMKCHEMPILWTWLHEIEFRNAIRLQAFRGQIQHDEIDEILHKQVLGLDSGVYVSATAALAEVVREVELLEAAHSSILGTRAVDIMHVALAVVLKAKDFLTFDKRQAALAKAAGLLMPKLA